MNDCVQKFFYFYSQGNIIQAVQCIIQDANSSYDQLQSANPLLRQVVNFIDAAVFEISLEARYQMLILLKLEYDRQGSIPLQPEILSYLKEEGRFLFELLNESQETINSELPPYFESLLSVVKGSMTINAEKIEEIIKETPAHFHQLFRFHLEMVRGWERLKKIKPWIDLNLSKKSFEVYPWYPLKYNYPLPALEDIADRIPVIFFEPIQGDLTDFFLKLKGTQAVFVFPTFAHFFHMLWIPGMVDALFESLHLIYILELYPNAQFLNQVTEAFTHHEFYPIFFSKTKHLEAYGFPLLEALKAYLNLPKSDYLMDNETGDWLYEVSKRLLLSIRQERLGYGRIPALQMHIGQLKWYDMHKGVPLHERFLGPPLNDYMAKILANLSQRRAVRARGVKDRLKLAHVVPQIVYGGHAPTRILENLVLYHDQEQFEVKVMSTELLQEHMLEYPYNFYTSHSSELRSGNLPMLFQEKGVETMINKQHFTYLDDAYNLSEHLNKSGFDVVVFHGPDIVNTMAAQMINAPLRVLFEHGTPPVYPGYDLAILSSDAAVELHEETLKKIQTQAKALPFAVDVRKGWQEKPYQRETLGLPEESLVMTTISTKLDARLTDKMCHAIARILKINPQAVYAPIGAISNPQRIRDIFAQYEVSERFYPLGSLNNPSQYARSMHLYLNEFPFGSCLAILDAMAAGCPVVTMFDAQGPQQARYGGHFMGIDRAISDGNVEAYIHLACQLLNNKEMYQEWSLRAMQQYDKYADVQGYVRSFEEIILDYMNEYS